MGQARAGVWIRQPDLATCHKRHRAVYASHIKATFSKQPHVQGLAAGLHDRESAARACARKAQGQGQGTGTAGILKKCCSGIAHMHKGQHVQQALTFPPPDNARGRLDLKAVLLA